MMSSRQLRVKFGEGNPPPGRHARNKYYVVTMNPQAPPGLEKFPGSEQYWLQCAACLRAHTQNPSLAPMPQIVRSSVKTMDRHLLNKCPYFDLQTEFTWPAVIGNQRRPILPIEGVKTTGGNRAATKREAKDAANKEISNDSKQGGVDQPHNPAPIAKLRAPTRPRGRPPGSTTGSTTTTKKRRRNNSPGSSTSAAVALSSASTGRAEILLQDCVDLCAELNDPHFAVIKAKAFQDMIHHLDPGLSLLLPLPSPSPQKVKQQLQDCVKQQDMDDREDLLELLDDAHGLLPGLGLAFCPNKADHHEDEGQLGTASRVWVHMQAAAKSAIVLTESVNYLTNGNSNGNSNANRGAILAKYLEEDIIFKQGKAFLQEQGYTTKTIGSVCFSGGGQTAGYAHRVMALRWPTIVFSPAPLSQQFNLMFKDFLSGEVPKETLDAAVLEQACAAVKRLHGSPFWMCELQTHMAQEYGHGQGQAKVKVNKPLLPPHWSQWMSIQPCVASLLRIKSACHAMVAQHTTTEDDDMQMMIPAEIQCFGLPDFWHSLESGHSVLRPLVQVSRLLLDAEDGGFVTLADITFIYLYLFHVFKDKPDAQSVVETQWRQLETPLYVLAFCLCPKYAAFAKQFVAHQEEETSSEEMESGLFSISVLSKATAGYQAKLSMSSADANQIRKQCRSYLKKLTTGDLPILMDVGAATRRTMSYVTYWKSIPGSFALLGSFASRLLGTCVQPSGAARQDLERLGSHHAYISSGAIKTPTTNHNQTVEFEKCQRRVRMNQREQSKVRLKRLATPTNPNDLAWCQNQIVDATEMIIKTAFNIKDDTDAPNNANAHVENKTLQLQGADDNDNTKEEDFFATASDQALEQSISVLRSSSQNDDKRSTGTSIGGYIYFWLEAIIATNTDPATERGGRCFQRDALEKEQSSEDVGLVKREGGDEAADDDEGSDSDVELSMPEATMDGMGFGSTHSSSQHKQTPRHPPWMTDMNFLAGYKAPDSPLPGEGGMMNEHDHGDMNDVPLPQERLAEVQNYRAAKISLGQMFGQVGGDSNNVPEEFANPDQALAYIYLG
jgi:hypothetical protein